ncbi:MAG: DNA primase [Candidatus Dadabacteria bacterium]
MSYSISESIVGEIRGRFSILSLIETYVSLKKSGRNYVGLCPFHNEKTPSFYVNDDKGIFHCFGCGTGGDIFGFMMRYNNLTFPEAVEELARRAGLRIEKNPLHAGRKSRRDTLFRLNLFASRFYHSMLIDNTEGRAARDYMRKRGISLETVKEFELGYAPGRWDALVRFLTEKKAPLKMAEEVGLIIKRKGGNGYYDRFRERIMFPIRDVDGRVIGFGGRALTQEKPKYINSPESEIYHKRSILYGIDRARDSIRKSGQVIMVEGYMDFLSLYSAGIKNVVATLGTSLTRNQVVLLRRYTDRIIVVLDGDESGEKASLRGLLEVFLEEGLLPLMVLLPDGDDPDSFISKGRGEEFLRLIAGAGSWLDFFIETVVRDFESGKIGRAKAAQMAIEIIAKIKNDIERSHYTKKLAEKFVMRENDFLSLVSRRESESDFKKARTQTRVELKKVFDTQERLILKVLLKFPKYSCYLKEENVVHFIADGEIKAILEEITLNGQSDVSSLLLKFNDPSTQEIISGAIFSSDDIPDESTAWRMLKDCIRKLKLKRIEDEFIILRLEMDRARREKNTSLEEKLIREYRDLIEREKNIKGEAHED